MEAFLIGLSRGCLMMFEPMPVSEPDALVRISVFFAMSLFLVFPFLIIRSMLDSLRARRKKPSPQQEPSSFIQPFKSREEYLKARDEMDLGEFLDRCFVTPKEVIAKKLPDTEIALCSGIGPWYRVKSGYNAQGELVQRVQKGCTAPLVDRFGGSHLWHELEEAIPRAGEWWQQEKTHPHPHPFLEAHCPIVWTNDLETRWPKERLVRAVQEECLFPVAFGKSCLELSQSPGVSQIGGASGYPILPIGTPYDMGSGGCGGTGFGFVSQCVDTGNPTISSIPDWVRVGHWVRGTKDMGFPFVGKLAKIVEILDLYVRICRQDDQLPGITFHVTPEHFELAFPKKGERWKKLACAYPHTEQDKSVNWTIDPTQWAYDSNKNYTAEYGAALCGCLVPCAPPETK